MNYYLNLITKLALPLFILFYSLEVKCQTDLRPGFIITNNNDTIHGLVDYRGDLRNSRKCDFQTSKGASIQEFLPGDIKGYRFNEGKFYVSKTIPSNEKRTEIFLEFLVDGIANLYYSGDGSNAHYYIEKEDGRIYELTNEKKSIRVEGKEYIGESKRYIGLLTFAFADCQRVFPLINRAKLNDKSLIEITKKYHDYVCNGEKCVIYEKQLPTVRIRIAPYISMNQSFLRIGNNPLYELVKFKASGYSSFGLLLNTSLPKASEKLSFRLSGEYGKSYTYGSGTYGSKFEEVQLHVSMLTLKGGLKYTYPVGKLRPTLVLGGNFLKLLNKIGRRVEEELYSSTIYSSESKDVPVAGYLVGYHAEIGFDYRFSPSLVTFLNLGFMNSINSKGAWGAQSLIDDDSSTSLKIFQLHVGIYF